MSHLSVTEKLQVFKKLCKFCKNQKGKSNDELSQLLNNSFSATTFYYLHCSDAIKSTRILNQTDDSSESEGETPSHSRANTAESADIAVQTPILQASGAHTQTSPKSTNAQKKAKKDKSELIKDFLKEFSTAERPIINNSPIDEYELQESERCDDREKLVSYIKKNMARLKSTQLDEIQMRILIWGEELTSIEIEIHI